MDRNSAFVNIISAVTLIQHVCVGINPRYSNKPLICLFPNHTDSSTSSSSSLSSVLTSTATIGWMAAVELPGANKPHYFANLAADITN